MRVILVDDEAMALNVLEAELSRYKDIKIVGSYQDPILALHNLETTRPDVIFLDIEMGPINGLVIAEDFIEKMDGVEIVFTTAYSEYAIKAFELNVIDYLLKPIRQNRLEKTIKRLRHRKNNRVDIKEREAVLNVECFGKLEATNSSGQTLSWRTQKSKELFAYLIVQKDKQALKDVIMDTIFPEKELEKANTLMHTTIYQLRKNLKSIGFNKSISLKNGWYRLSIPLDTDFDVLDRIIDSKEYNEEDIDKIIKIYKGDFLEYEAYHWMFGIQYKYKDRILKILDYYTKTRLENNQYPPNLIKALELIYKIEPYDKKSANKIIEFYGKQGQVNHMEDFFKYYKNKLWSDLDVGPSESTINLFSKYL